MPGWIVVPDPAQVDLPMPVAGRFGIIGDEGRTALRMDARDNHAANSY